MNASASATGGVGFTGALVLLLIALKLCGVITVSWWLIVAVACLPAAFLLGFLLVVALGLLLRVAVEAAVDRWKGRA
ncbi:hypothetical protein [Nocardia sp. CC216A]|uniref:hypothetical protein n=1 Tax=Nocardia sp. CC216A TaxID=3044158 RepID=UPI00279587C7|nr:hypothetical protein [Nocardia sp. CC216A]